MANKLVSVDENLHLPVAVRNQLKADVESDVSASVTAAQTAAANASLSATAAVDARDEAVAAAEFVTAPSDTQVAAYVGGTGGATRAALDARYATLDALADFEAQAASIEELDGALPQFRRVGDGSPVLTVGTQNPAPNATSPGAADSIYWPWVIDARAILGEGAMDEFYLYYSTDHAAAHGASGIWLATGPTELGPWTGRGRVWRDDVSGTQTETPTVYPDPTGAATLVMLYQQQGVSGAVGSQSTMWATSDDGVTWTRGGIAIDVSAWMSGDGHTGYARAARIGGAIYAHHLRGGNTRPHFGLSVSYDGRRFHHVHMQGYARDLLPDGRRVEWNAGDVISWRGRLVWVGLCSDFASGSTPKDARIAVAPLSPDLRQLLAPPVYQLYPTQGDEDTNYRSCRAFRARDGRLLLYYQSGGAFYVAEAI